MPRLLDTGLIVIIWSAGAWIFQDFFLNVDTSLRRLINGESRRDEASEEQRRRFGIATRVLFGLGLAAFGAGAWLRVNGVG